MPDIRYYFDQFAVSPERGEFGDKEIVVYSSRSPEKSTRNEDSVAWVAWPKALLVVLADGVGGQPEGGSASELAVQLVVDRFKNVNDDQIGMEVFREGVLDAFERANREVLAMENGAGTTLTAAAVCDGCVRVFNVGDSGTLVCGGKGKIKFSNTPHSPTGYAVAAGVLNEDDALHHDERHLISNIVGSMDMHIDIGPTLKLEPRDRLVVASDGLWDNMYVDEIINAVRIVPLSKAAHVITQTCAGRMTQEAAKLPGHADDLSFVVLRSVKRKPRAQSELPLTVPLPDSFSGSATDS